MQTLNGGMVVFLEEMVVEKLEIETILPHRRRMLLLDEVTIEKESLKGKLAVRPEICEGHAVFGGQLVMKGSDLYDMAAQLLGVYIGLHFRDSKDSHLCLPRSYGLSKFKKPIFPGDVLEMEISLKDIEDLVVGKEQEKTLLVKGKLFSARVGQEKRAQISDIMLIVASKP